MANRLKPARKLNAWKTEKNSMPDSDILIKKLLSLGAQLSSGRKSAVLGLQTGGVGWKF
jgi:hypothetical protein